MMNHVLPLLVIGGMLASARPAAVDVTSASGTNPTLNTIYEHNFSTAYSCNGSYATSGLGLAPQEASPDILFNGACVGATFFDVSFGGADFALISLIGGSEKFPIEEVSAQAAFNFANVAGKGNVFQASAPAKSHSTYAILRTASPSGMPGAVRTLFTVETLDGCENPSKPCNIRYAVLDYSTQITFSRSPGFDWEKHNAPPLQQADRNPGSITEKAP